MKQRRIGTPTTEERDTTLCLESLLKIRSDLFYKTIVGLPGDNTLCLERGRQVVAFGYIWENTGLTEISPKLSMEAHLEFTTLLPSASRVPGLQVYETRPGTLTF